ncbi:thiol:disulfide interchange protein [Thalassotalea insulae]|uniref:Thiol:disulfide interchange protein n=1 Tax=Thalassotalea insulae TaxID=2056778 RepID=A0ABQ6GX30_9GAMM|nr:DsbE family thiol:disulfide interchange protein [Thalassotalea insulae]GLX79172.1 thiol:disulfide interchange protein [Thalassotalea insulae]
MNKIIRFIPLVLFIALGVVLYRGLSLNPQALPSALVGQKVPSFVLTQLLKPDNTLTEKDLQGDIVLLNVWGTWCVYCKYEHPYLVDIAQSGRVALYGLNYKDDRQDAKQWLVDYQNPYQLSIFDPLGKLGIELGVTAAPETFVIDKQGIIRMKHVGPIDGDIWQQKFLPMIEILEQES